MVYDLFVNYDDIFPVISFNKIFLHSQKPLFVLLYSFLYFMFFHSCNCCCEHLDLDPKQEPTFSQGLNEGQEEKWDNILREKGLTPYGDETRFKKETICKKCNDTGVIETGNNDLPCDCPAGATALFNEAGVDGPVTGDEIRRHFLNNSPEHINPGKTIPAWSLPGRKLSFFLEITDNAPWLTQEYLEKCAKDIELQRNWEPKVDDWYFCIDFCKIMQIINLSSYYSEGQLPSLKTDHGKSLCGRWMCDIYLPLPEMEVE